MQCICAFGGCSKLASGMKSEENPYYYVTSQLLNSFISGPELKIGWKVLDWSAYHAAATTAPHLRLNVSVAIDTRLQNRKLQSRGEKVFLY